jgi:hypothetical protein
MRVRIQNTEGLVFLSRVTPTVTIDVGALGDDERSSLEQMVKDARFFDLPARIPASRGPQQPTCHITIEASGRQHSISVSDPVQGPALRRLVDRLRELGGARDQVRDEDSLSELPAPRSRPSPTSRVRTSR